ncbi:hypothetical protein [Microvirgula aerodenitrificans]|uniref:hypothetical protein n=1 Tax=Microvirgula aerodenitrificans TaxID=57480 RepID=UPI00248F190D|nr:hypothetical protein [Microvirgula aerodenitrificans]
MSFPAPRMDAEQFDRVASASCKKWSERSLGVAKALIVEGVSLADAAAAHSMSPQQASVTRGRFLEKVETLRMDEFMRREKPKLAISALEPYSVQIQTLRDKGYTIDQIVAFLKESGVTTSPTTVRTFLKGLRA